MCDHFCSPCTNVRFTQYVSYDITKKWIVTGEGDLDDMLSTKDKIIISGKNYYNPVSDVVKVERCYKCILEYMDETSPENMRHTIKKMETTLKKHEFKKLLGNVFLKDIQNIIQNYYKPLGKTNYEHTYDMVSVGSRIDTVSVSSCRSVYSGFNNVSGCECMCEHFRQYKPSTRRKQYNLPDNIIITIERSDDTDMCDICDENIELDAVFYKNKKCNCLYHIYCIKKLMGGWGKCPSCEGVVPTEYFDKCASCANCTY